MLTWQVVIESRVFTCKYSSLKNNWKHLRVLLVTIMRNELVLCKEKKEFSKGILEHLIKPTSQQNSKELPLSHLPLSPLPLPLGQSPSTYSSQVTKTSTSPSPVATLCPHFMDLAAVFYTPSLKHSCLEFL